MILGIPKETLNNESRVAAIPATIKQYISAGFSVVVESGAGNLSQISDQDYKQVGAEILSDATSVYAKSDMILKVNSPTEEEINIIKDGDPKWWRSVNLASQPSHQPAEQPTNKLCTCVDA